MTHSDALASAFDIEWTNLDADRRRVILRDFREAVTEEGLTAPEYRVRIGRGNLKAYGDVMLVRERKGWD